MKTIGLLIYRWQTLETRIKDVAKLLLNDSLKWVQLIIRLCRFLFFAFFVLVFVYFSIKNNQVPKEYYQSNQKARYKQSKNYYGIIK